jgi:hypothetical protein
MAVPCAALLFSQGLFARPPRLARPSGEGAHLRAKARNRGSLHSKSQPIVTITSEDNQTYAVIQAANPQVINVPTYAPAVIWGLRPPYYPYPTANYAGALVAASPISARASLWVRCGRTHAAGGGIPGWGDRTVIVNNDFIRNHHFNNINVNKNNVCQHDRTHNPGRPRLWLLLLPGTTGLVSPGLSAGKSERL